MLREVWEEGESSNESSLGHWKMNCGRKVSWNTYLLQAEIKWRAFLPRSASLVCTPEK